MARLGRWRIKLQEYEYEMVYKPGKIHTNADALSRNPILQTERNIEHFYSFYPKILSFRRL